MIINWQAVKRKNLVRLAIDFFMLSVALINILLISFDLTYLKFRSIYYWYVPNLVEWYDTEIKGIEPHRFTEDYLDSAGKYFQTVNQGETEPQLQQSLIEKSIEMIDTDPFKNANKSGNLEVIKERMRVFTNNQSSKDAFAYFWLELDQENYRQWRNFFEAEISPLIATNYWRHIDRTGDYVDNFLIKIDIWFILIFLSEFLFMWIYSIRKFGPDQKVIYPLYHWYDIVSFIPLAEFRFLRLFRFLSVYVRLKNSDIVVFGEGPISRLISKYKDIAAEELSDRVAMDILVNIRKEVELGINQDVIREVMIPHKEAIRNVAVKNMHKISNRAINKKQSEWVGFITEVIDDTLAESTEFRKIKQIPYVGDKIKTLVTKERINDLVAHSMDNFSIALDKALHTEKGQVFLEGLFEDILDEIILTMDDPMFKELNRQINLKLLDELIKGIDIKTWKVEKELREKEIGLLPPDNIV